MHNPELHIIDYNSPEQQHSGKRVNLHLYRNHDEAEERLHLADLVVLANAREKDIASVRNLGYRGKLIYVSDTPVSQNADVTQSIKGPLSEDLVAGLIMKYLAFRGHLLVVEDSPIVADVLEDRLSEYDPEEGTIKCQYEIRALNNTRDARKHIDWADLVITDLHDDKASMRSRRFLHSIRKRYTPDELAYIFITSRVNKPEYNTGPANVWLPRPLDFDDLVDAVYKLTPKALKRKETSVLRAD